MWGYLGHCWAEGYPSLLKPVPLPQVQSLPGQVEEEDPGGGVANG